MLRSLLWKCVQTHRDLHKLEQTISVKCKTNVTKSCIIIANINNLREILLGIWIEQSNLLSPFENHAGLFGVANDEMTQTVVGFSTIFLHSKNFRQTNSAFQVVHRHFSANFHLFSLKRDNAFISIKYHSFEI